MGFSVRLTKRLTSEDAQHLTPTRRPGHRYFIGQIFEKHIQKNWRYDANSTGFVQKLQNLHFLCTSSKWIFKEPMHNIQVTITTHLWCSGRQIAHLHVWWKSDKKKYTSNRSNNFNIGSQGQVTLKQAVNQVFPKI